MSDGNEAPPTVLVVDDDPRLRKTLELNLRARGYTPYLSDSGEHALRLVAHHHPGLVLLDLGLPGMSGLDVLRGLRGWTQVPVVVLSGRDTEQMKVRALDLGADDYVVKPFGMDELFARVRAALRRTAPAAGQGAVVETGHFTVDLAAQQVTRGGEQVRLTPRQWHIVEVLVRNRGRLVTQRELLREVWGPEYERETNYLRVFMTKIRQRLEPDPPRPRYFLTDPGLGYRFQEEGRPPGDAGGAG
ncbi:response regulator [Nocardiopsis flavescens]|uniref:Two-component system, OmpR family, KDP operon response regulator KdpE n=1 Tax=Nocardiopsis flavescens TaxID=758803 RepID=A0A1M6L3K8_9ACTN|nr:response regulator [Nocardiopsis flavescens]SHJ65780.1 two-component system, OmpR family, KDP operon response regulator KdpE [Nocardiopsis flavescens]